MSDKILNKLKCAGCGDYYQSKYSDEDLQKKYPVRKKKLKFRDHRNMRKWIKLKRELKCPTCGDTTKISKKLLMEISKMNYEKKTGEKL